MPYICGQHRDFVTDDGATFMLHVLLVHLDGVAFEQELLREAGSAMYAAPRPSVEFPLLAHAA